MVTLLTLLTMPVLTLVAIRRSYKKSPAVTAVAKRVRAGLFVFSGLLLLNSLVITFRVLGAVSGVSLDPSQRARIMDEGMREVAIPTMYATFTLCLGLAVWAALRASRSQLEGPPNQH